MTDFKELIARRRSHRKFTTEEIDSEDVEKILRAALMSPSSKRKRDWQFIVIDENDALEKLA
ncbi:MAG: nitroreductase family protein, partial [Prevotella sp.]|nr:nitroreductase family protein [Prevotella sp.]